MLGIGAEGDWGRMVWTREWEEKVVERSWKRVERELKGRGGDLESSGGEMS